MLLIEKCYLLRFLCKCIYIYFTSKRLFFFFLYNIKRISLTVLSPKLKNFLYENMYLTIISNSYSFEVKISQAIVYIANNICEFFEVY